MNPQDEAFLEDVAQSVDSCVATAVTRLQGPSAESAELEDPEYTTAYELLSDRLKTPEERQAFETAVRDALTGLAHSVMVTLDGGSAFSDEGAPQLLHADGSAFADGLHELLFDHLGATGRLP